MSNTSVITNAAFSIDSLNQLSDQALLEWLNGIYEHSPWVGEAALKHKPFLSLAHLKWALSDSVTQAGHEQQLALIQAHPVLAAKPASGLTAESQTEQRLAGLWQSTPEQAAQLQSLNQEYLQNFGWPFIIAVRGPRRIPRMFATNSSHCRNPFE